jgi:hypothetical protein
MAVVSRPEMPQYAGPLTTTGSPCAMASSTTMAKVSSRVGCTSTSAAR